MTRMNELPSDQVIVIQPLKTFPLIKDLVTDVSWNYQQNKNIATFNPGKKQKLSYVESAFKDNDIPVVAATDYMKIFADQIREFIPNKYIVLGTDGFGRSDTRSQLRKFFEVNRYYIVVASLKALVEEGKLSTDKINEAIKKYNIDQNKPEPTSI